MYSLEITPRFNDTDALGHINNASFVTWLEEARRPVFQEFNPTLSIERWNLILARVEVDYLSQCYYGRPVIVESFFEKIGTSSMILTHVLTQEKAKVARGKSILVFFNYDEQKSILIPEDIKQRLKAHLKRS